MTNLFELGNVSPLVPPWGGFLFYIVAVKEILRLHAYTYIYIHNIKFTCKKK